MADKKELKVTLVPNSGSMYEIYYVGGGEIPEALKGMYTSEYIANVRVIQHLMEEKVKLQEAANRKRKSERMDELRERDLA